MPNTMPTVYPHGIAKSKCPAPINPPKSDSMGEVVNAPTNAPIILPIAPSMIIATAICDIMPAVVYPNALYIA